MTYMTTSLQIQADVDLTSLFDPENLGMTLFFMVIANKKLHSHSLTLSP